jgi:hypothetical protein
MIENKIDTSLLEVQQSMVCEITKFNKQTMRADVQPLLSEEPVGNAVARTFPIISNIPVKYLYDGAFYMRPDYQVGTMVWVTFATHEIDDSLKGEKLEASKVVFDIANACVMGGVARTGATTPAEFDSEDGLLIGHKDGAAYLKFESDKITAIFGTKKVELSNGGMRFFDGVLWTNFMTHKHIETGVVTLSPTAGT